MYLPLSSSTPIFVGGLVRYVVDRFGRKRADRPASELESEMSPGVLLSDRLHCRRHDCRRADRLSQLQRHDRQDSGGRGNIAPRPLRPRRRSTGNARPWPRRNSAPKALRLTADRASDRRDPRTQRIATPPLCPGIEGNDAESSEERALQSAGRCPAVRGRRAALGSGDKASLLFDLNESQLKLPESLPADAMLKIPQEPRRPHHLCVAGCFLVVVGGDGSLNRQRPTTGCRNETRADGFRPYIHGSTAMRAESFSHAAIDASGSRGSRRGWRSTGARWGPCSPTA